MRREEVQGIGLGFRFPHAFDVISTRPDIPWFEVIADDLLLASGRLAVVDKLRVDYPIALHGVGLNIAGSAPIDEWYLERWRELDTRFAPAWFSDHLCWSASPGRQHFDLLPFPLSRRMLRHVTSRVAYVQERLGRELVLENISYYLSFDGDEMSEWHFLHELSSATGCKVLLDLNNMWTNAANFERDVHAELDAAIELLGSQVIVQVHLAGGAAQPVEHCVDVDTAATQSYWIDTHGEPVKANVVGLYRELCARVGKVPAIIERDSNLPAFTELAVERLAVERSCAAQAPHFAAEV